MIGIFDSGIGGLTVVRAFMDVLPDYDIIYFGDTARTPYGNKSAGTVAGYAKENIDFLIKKGAKIIIAACNTASSFSKEVFSDIDIPCFEVITPTAETAVKISKKGAIGVIGTRATISSGVYEKKIKELSRDATVYSYPAPLLVPLVEEGWTKKPETAMIIKKYLLPLKTRQIDTLILGCTHYPVLRKKIEAKIGKNAKIVDSSSITFKVKEFLHNKPELDGSLSKTGSMKIFVSDITETFKKMAADIIKNKISLELVRK